MRDLKRKLETSEFRGIKVFDIILGFFAYIPAIFVLLFSCGIFSGIKDPLNLLIIIGIFLFYIFFYCILLVAIMSEVHGWLYAMASVIFEVTALILFFLVFAFVLSLPARWFLFPELSILYVFQTVCIAIFPYFLISLPIQFLRLKIYMYSRDKG